MTAENWYLIMILPLTLDGDVYILRDQWSDRATGAAKDSSDAADGRGRDRRPGTPLDDLRERADEIRRRDDRCLRAAAVDQRD
jgi:hypothetical protein